MLLIATDVPQQYKGTVLLLFHGNSGYVKEPQCYIKHTLPVFFWFMPTSLTLQRYKSSQVFCLSQHFKVRTADFK